MALLTLDQVSKSFGPSTVLEAVSFHVQPGDRIGVVGANGAGKSTLLKLLTGELEPDSGRIQHQPGSQLGYLPQERAFEDSATIETLVGGAVADLRELEQRLRALEAALAELQGDALAAVLAEYGEALETFEQRGGYDLAHRINAVLTGLRLDYLPRDRRLATLSGGEAVRSMLACLLLQQPDVLLLDEPTNHLDARSADWLEEFLAAYPGAVLAVSHDRRFLNRVVSRIFEVDEHSHRLREHAGTYDAFRAAKAAELMRWQADYERQQEEIRELQRIVKSRGRDVSHRRAPTDNDKFAKHFFRERVDQAVARTMRNAEERLQRLEAAPIPRPPRPLHVNPDLDPAQLRSDRAVSVLGLRKAFGERVVLADVTFELGSRARVVVTGENGAGKSTLLDIIAGRLQPDAGEVRLGSAVRLGYLDQAAARLAPGRTLLETYLEGLAGHRDELLNDLFHYGLFRAADLTKQVAQLSLGARRKLQLARLIAHRANVLLLDEPTNQLSLDLVEALETALQEFPGAILAVSHDRWFVERFGGEVWELRAGRLLQPVAGGTR